MYKRNEQIGDLKIIRILKNETINTLGYSSWDELVNDKDVDEGEIIYLVSTPDGIKKLTGDELYEIICEYSTGSLFYSDNSFDVIMNRIHSESTIN